MFIVSHKLNKHLIYAYVYEELLDYPLGSFYSQLYVTEERFQCILATQQTHEIWCAIRNKC